MTGPDPRLQPGARVRVDGGRKGVVQHYQRGLADPQVPIRLCDTGQTVLRSIGSIDAIGWEQPTAAKLRGRSR